MLSKSDFLKYIQCKKLLWLHKNRKDLLPDELTLAQQNIFEQGDLVESYSRKLFPEWVEIKQNFQAWENETKKFVNEWNKVIYQATAIKDNLLARIDIFLFNENTQKWDIYEVKSWTKVDDIHIYDITFQKVVFEGVWYDIWDTYVVHINNEYVRDGDIDIKQLFSIENVNEKVKEIESEVLLLIDNAKKVLDLKEEPKVKILKQCTSPHTCAFKDNCWKNIPEKSIYDLPRIRENRLLELIDRDILMIKDIPDDIKLSDNQKTVVDVIKYDKKTIDKININSFFDELQYPLYFIDYESFNNAIPMYDKMKPYQQVCFQYSLHIQETPNSELKHIEFIWNWNENPIYGLVESMRENIWDTGSVIVWNRAFEATRNKEMAKAYPKYSSFLNDLNVRMWDLMVPFAKFWYAHPDFRWSASIKKVLPVLVPSLSYKTLWIQEWLTASISWFQKVQKHWYLDKEDKVFKDLSEYCHLDTLAMVEIFDVVKREINF